MKHIRTLEEWKDIKGYEGLYQVSDLGRVRSLDRVDCNGRRRKGKILKLYKNKDGYVRTELYKDGNRENPYVNRLVAEAFCPNPDNLPFVNHCNERRDDNKAFNLDWCTAKQNNNYGSHNELLGKALGEEVCCIETREIYYSAREAGRQTGVDRASISKCCNGKRKTAGGYHWKYVNR